MIYFNETTILNGDTEYGCFLPLRRCDCDDVMIWLLFVPAGRHNTTVLLWGGSADNLLIVREHGMAFDMAVWGSVFGRCARAICVALCIE